MTINDAVIAALIAAAVSLLTIRFSYHNLYARTVSQSRMDWINSFREELAVVIAAMRCPCTNEKLYQAEKARAKLLTRLNQNTAKSGNEYNQVMAELLEDIKFSAVCNNDQRTQLLEVARKILEPEWQRVKREARGR